MRSLENPIFKSIAKKQGTGDANAFGDVSDQILVDVATYKGIFLKTLLSIGVVILTTIAMILLVYYKGLYLKTVDGETYLAAKNWVYVLMVVGAIGGFLFSILANVSVKLSGVFTLIYSVFEGLFLGVVSGFANIYVPGAIFIAAGATLGIFLIMLGLYSIKAVRVTNRFLKVMMVLGIGILIFIPINIILYLAAPGFFGSKEYLYISIAISVGLIIYGAFMLTIDFEHCRNLVENQIDKKHEWQAALGLLLTIVWIYVEIIRLIIIIAANRD